MAEQNQGDQLEPTYSSCVDTGCSNEDLPKAMNDWEGWQERVRDMMARQEDNESTANRDPE